MQKPDSMRASHNLVLTYRLDWLDGRIRRQQAVEEMPQRHCESSSCDGVAKHEREAGSAVRATSSYAE